MKVEEMINMICRNKWNGKKYGVVNQMYMTVFIWKNYDKKPNISEGADFYSLNPVNLK